jgi:predicted RNA-binding Zn-ribbon protein involved in translation (DUF1610 family)
VKVIHKASNKEKHLAYCGSLAQGNSLIARGWKRVNCPECGSARLARTENERRKQALWKAAPDLLDACTLAFHWIYADAEVVANMSDRERREKTNLKSREEILSRLKAALCRAEGKEST